MYVDRVVNVVEKDTVLVSKPDSLYYNAYIECINNKPVLRDPEQKNTKGVKSAIQLQDGKLSVKVETEAQNLFLKWKEIYEKQNSGSVKIKPVAYPVDRPVPAELTKWQKYYLGVGKVVTWLCMGALLTLILSKIPWKALLRL